MKVFEQQLIIGNEYYILSSDYSDKGIFVGCFNGCSCFYPTNEPSIIAIEEDGTIEMPHSGFTYEEV